MDQKSKMDQNSKMDQKSKFDYENSNRTEIQNGFRTRGIKAKSQKSSKSPKTGPLMKKSKKMFDIKQQQMKNAGCRKFNKKEIQVTQNPEVLNQKQIGGKHTKWILKAN